MTDKNDDAQGISMEDFMNELIASEEAAEDTVEVTPEAVEEHSDGTPVEDSDGVGDSEDDILAELDEDEADDNPEEKSETEEDDDSEDEDKTYTFKADGEEVTVTLDELKKSYGLQKNLTRKGQELSEKEKQTSYEADVIAYYKQTPERQQMSEQIVAAEEAVQRGTFFDQEGNPIQMTEQQIKETMKNIGDAKAKLNELAPPPGSEKAREEIPELWSSDANVRDAAVKQYGDYLMSIGYTQAELTHISPRELLLAKAALKGDELATRVEAAKARKANKPKPGVVSKVTKAAKGKPESSNKRGTSKPKMSEAELAKKVESGEISMTDSFLLLDD